MINAHVPRPTDVEQDLSQSFAGIPDCNAPIGVCESKEQADQSRRIEILKRWEIGINMLDRGCIVKIGCKSIAFTSIEAGYKEIGRYLESPQFMATEHGFEEHI